MLYKHMPNDSYDEDRVVIHTSCALALIDAAPTAPPARHHAAAAAEIRRQVLTTGDAFAAVG